MPLADRIREALAGTPLVGVDDEFDPFAASEADEPPEEEGDDRVHEEVGDGARAPA